ncbi:zinc-binding dehydrogenase [Paenibacillus sp. GCM10012307]|uniref:Galactitol-1-phosphate 5-dehydrogenase n=1 Tax=Paenibacillus roseus TaxID=2798579 RepID=A0A934IYB2_9BACL|nr:galactitol-1-phosphate 5-dehydrogenase [Paenibacillus roseus]MBJ6361487.1 galactitol-1-phosphate 5-dehydrogenase [Paenibacillus roseus]
MKALIYEGPMKMAVRQTDKPVPGEDDIVIQVAYSGICGSELSGFLGENSLRQPPLIFGHEFSGTIAAMGERALTAGWSLGDRVTANPLVTCGRCTYCLAGSQQLCTGRKLLSAALPGSNAEYVAVPAAFVHKISDSLSLREAAFVEPAACAVRAAELAEPKPTDTVVVIGMGPIGMLIMQALRQYGVRAIIAVDRNRDRLAIASRLGAANTFCPDDGDTVELLRKLADGRGVDIAIDAVGAEATRRQCVQACAPGGRVVFTGLHEEESSLHINAIIRSEIRLTGAFAYSEANFRTALRWLEEGRIGLSEGIIEAPLEEGEAWFDLLIRRPGSISKVLLKPGGDEA